MNTIYFLNAYHLGCSWPPWPLGPRGPGPTRYGRTSELQTTPFWFYVAIFIEMMVWPKINAANVVSTPTAKGAKEAAPVAVTTKCSPLCLTSHHLKWIGIRVEFWPDPFSNWRKRFSGKDATDLFFGFMSIFCFPSSFTDSLIWVRHEDTYVLNILGKW